MRKYLVSKVNGTQNTLRVYISRTAGRYFHFCLIESTYGNQNV